MRKFFNWVIAATFICGASVLTSCSDNNDNPVEPEKPVVNADRQAFEKEFSSALQKSAEQIRFDALKQALVTIGTFFETIDEDALGEQVTNMIPDILTNTDPILFENLSEEEFKAVSTTLNERFDMSEEEVKKMDGFLLVDAYNTIGTKKVTFKDGKATQSENDGFCIENIDKDGKSSSITLKFKDKRDGVRFFAARLAKVMPVCIQFPQQIDITVSTAYGFELSGSVFLSTNAPSRYISFKHSQWTGVCGLTADYEGRNETLQALINHGKDRSFDFGVGFGIDGVDKAALIVQGMNKPYSDEYIDSEELKSLRDCGPFFSAAYDVLKAINGSTVDDIEFTLGNRLVFTVSVDDVAACLLALGNIRKMHGTQPGFEAVDKYTQILNDHFHYTVGIKDTNIKAQGSLVTVVKGFNEKEFQPALALQFAGETKPMVLMDRMSEQDMANYKKMTGAVEEMSEYVSEMVKKLKEKFSGIKL